jgi:hypothetical protein
VAADIDLVDSSHYFERAENRQLDLHVRKILGAKGFEPRIRRAGRYSAAGDDLGKGQRGLEVSDAPAQRSGLHEGHEHSCRP